MGFFTSSIYDEDLCFCRDIMAVAYKLANYTSKEAIMAVIRPIIEEKGLILKLNEFFKYPESKIKDCYPSDRRKLLSNAASLLKFVKAFQLNGIEESFVSSRAYECIKKMNLSNSEKENLIWSCIVEKTNVESIDNLFLETYIPLL